MPPARTGARVRGGGNRPNSLAVPVAAAAFTVLRLRLRRPLRLLAWRRALRLGPLRLRLRLRALRLGPLRLRL